MRGYQRETHEGLAVSLCGVLPRTRPLLGLRLALHPSPQVGVHMAFLRVFVPCREEGQPSVGADLIAFVNTLPKEDMQRLTSSVQKEVGRLWCSRRWRRRQECG